MNESTKIAMPKTFIARVRKKGPVLEVTIPSKIVKALGLRHGDFVEMSIIRIVAHSDV